MHHYHIPPSAPASSASASATESRGSGHDGDDASSSGSHRAGAAADEEDADEEDQDDTTPSGGSSVHAHVYEGGLRYHAFRDGKYAFPNDEVEQNRDDMKHSMSLLLCHGDYFYAPIEEVLAAGGAEVLDLGTGTGIWAIELGDKYPEAKITGIDLSPIQPNFVPQNVHFFVDDFEEDWVDADNKYDYIHIRHTLFSIRDRDLLFQRALRHLKPGGYLELQELHFAPQCDDNSLTPQMPYAFRDYIAFLDAGLRALGSELHAVRTLPEDLHAAGFEDVEAATHKCPLGLWPRDRRLRLCGLFLRTAVMDGLRGLSRRPLIALGWTQLQIEMFLVDVRKAVMDTKVHAYFGFHVVYGRKPLA
ncbi:S-adenosyl-L-methionine-dependent methyltransferase [Lasiosphaeris hirsuta]|uniref:S-adenosyl-L-methionine-dependent methyltransferase n=1 Tax=Lasiosphaeris hirsuta TaxID=260670 RepID=A0AA40A3G6_9PEZI|nr:S-adenosyl-L-methionine-dependent methyltransferase [Lasiosphaeris hirsuta]